MQNKPNTIRFRTGNGLTLLVIPRPSVQVVTVDMWVSAGSADETAEINGVSHFLEHMLFKGTDRYRVGEIDRLIESAGGVINAGTSHDFTHYYVTVASDQFDTALLVISEVIQNSTLDEDELNNERQVILEEYYRKQDAPQGLLWERLYDAMFIESPYKAPVLGIPDSLARIGRVEMMDYYHRHYAPSNMVLLVVGNVDPAAVHEQVERAFSGFSRPYRPVLQGAERSTRYASNTERIIDKAVNESYCAMAFPAPALRDPAETAAMDVLQFVLGAGEASILSHEIKEKRQLATSIGVSYSSARHPDLFTVFATCDEARRDAMEAAVLAEIEQVVQSPLPQPMLDRARRLLINSHAFSMETVNGHSSCVGYYYTITGDTTFEERYIEGIAAVTAQDVQREAQNWLRPEYMNRVVVRPKKQR